MKDLRQYRARRVIVETEGGPFEGVIDSASETGLVLSGAQMLSDEGGRRPVDGLLAIPVGRILYVQVPR